ncbi:low molecular weight phosphatase family protein [Litoribacter ruber]|uniref:protein-tyrosine-phosphatase n=1 Tax=Litoribacter ruber TaxID=702568 RepID=UPI00293D8C42|nr:protein-tyrosine-phosphatase [Litoribacter ruber]
MSREQSESGQAEVTINYIRHLTFDISTSNILMNLYPKLQSFINQLPSQTIPSERKEYLQALIDYIQTKLDAGKPIRLNFICTHNSRRSQFSQIWAQLAADLHGIDADCFSGGVEVTAFNERAVESMKRTGFKVTKNGDSNPKYYLFYSDDANPIVAFSKLYDEIGSDPYAAVMTCSHADENCPFIPAAEVRIPVRYEDPKAFDDTAQEAEKYDERSLQIASEMFHVFSQVKVKA